MVVRLGGFQLLISARGKVFHVVKGSGIEEALEEVYAPNVVTNMMSCIAISRGLCGLYFIEVALMGKVLKSLLMTIQTLLLKGLANTVQSM